MNGSFFSSKRNLFLILTLVSICLLLLSFLLPAAGQDKNKKQLFSRQTSFEPAGTLMNINDISMWIYSSWAYREVETWNLALFTLLLVNPGILFVCPPQPDPRRDHARRPGMGAPSATGP